MAEKDHPPDQKEGQGFKVVDRRRIGHEDAEPRAEAPAPVASPEPPAGGQDVESIHEQVLGPIDFQTFIVSLASSALIHLGEAPHPETGRKDASLPHAKQTIDLLALLAQKTSGNLTPDESSLLQDLLRDLRLRYVQVTSLHGRS